MRQFVLPCICLLLLAAPVLAADPMLARHEYSEVHMGTKFQLIFYAAEEKTARDGAKAARAQLSFKSGFAAEFGARGFGSHEEARGYRRSLRRAALPFNARR